MIRVERIDRVVHLVIDAPPVNVFDMAVLTELAEKLAELREDYGIAAVLLSGEGKCFSAGASVEEHKPEKAYGMLTALVDACKALADFPVPTVALIHGACMGGSAELIAFCDFVVADPGSALCLPEVKLAFFPPLACAHYPRLTGLQNAAYAVLTGETLDAQRAQSMGLIQELLPKEEWEKVAKRFNRLSVPVLRLAKKSLIEGAGSYHWEMIEHLKRVFVEELYKIEDVEEGIKSFEEKRRPEWKHQ